MKTLYERLSEENRQKIEDASKKWPTTMLILVTFLRQNYSWNLMRIDDAMSLHDAIEPSSVFDLSRFINFFDND